MSENHKIGQKTLFKHIRTMNQVVTIGPNLPEYFVDFCVRVEGVFNEQNSVNFFPNTDPGAVDRRAFTMSLYGILSAEVTRTGTFQNFSTSFSKLLLPLPSYKENEINQRTVLLYKSFTLSL